MYQSFSLNDSSITSIEKPCSLAYIIYELASSLANNAASSQPVPALTSSIIFFSSFLSFGIKVILSFSS